MPDDHLSDAGGHKGAAATVDAILPIAIPAREYRKSTGHGGYQWTSVEGLGYSGAVTLSPFDNHLFAEKRPHLAYEFELDKSATYPRSYEVQLRLLPTHANDSDFKVGVAANGDPRREYAINTQGRSEAWKENVLRNAVLVTHPVAITEGGRQTLTIDVSHTGIVLDQISVHPQGYGNFYEIDDGATVFQ